ncbi:MAG: hypothetical protein R6U19_06445 [Bacteroidales bacterium]
MKFLEDKMMSIELKVRQLITSRQNMEKRLDEVQQENQKLHALVAQKQTELERQIKVNQYKHIATSLSNQEKKQTRQKLNALVREIDQCIALLND